MSVTATIDNFSIEQICVSGQCFRMNSITDSNAVNNNPETNIEVIAFSKRLVVSQKGNKVTFNCSEEDHKKIWIPYFDLDTDYQQVISSIDKNDKYLLDAANRAAGIRILRQDLWEMIISFIISQRNNIKRIKKSISLLCEKYGEKLTAEDGSIFYDFPTPKALFEADISDLRALGLGYRDLYIKKTAEAVYLNEFDLNQLMTMEYKEAKELLLTLYGVGEKVADCICLFALHKTESFPKDTHINQVLEREYKNGFDFEKYKNTAGILQQYMFFNELF